MTPNLRTNRYADSCAKCRNQVPAGAGTLQGPPWRTICPACLPRPAQVVSRAITVTLAGDAIAFAPAGYLGEAFGGYRAALDGCRYNASAKLNLADTAELAERAIARLQAAGFAVDVAPEVAARIQAHQATAHAEVATADDRAAAVDAQLRARGMGLFPFQSIGVSWLAPRTRALLADEMGLGKTIQALIAAPAGAPIVVVCPAVAKGVWVREARKWRPDLTPVVLDGRGSYRWPAPGEMVVVNYDILPHVEDPDRIKPRKATARPQTPAAWHKAWVATWEAIGHRHHAAHVMATVPASVVLVADEAHALKTGKAQRTQRYRTLGKACRDRGGRTWLLTATPLLNNPGELWSVLVAGGLEREAFGSYPEFMRIGGGEKTRWGIEWDPHAIDQAAMQARLRRVMLRREKREVLPDLPPKLRSVITVDVPASATRLCDAAVRAIADRGMSLDDAIRLAMRSQHAELAFTELSRARAALATAKTEAAIELIESYEAAGEPVVVFSSHLAPLAALASRPGWASITGDTKPAERTRIEEAFQAGELRGIAAQIKSGGVAITLTRASNAIFVDLDWSPAWNVQAEDRIYRIGTARAVTIHVLVANHALDDRVTELLDEKGRTIAKTVEAAHRGATEVPPAVAADLDRAAAELAAAQADVRAYVERLALLAAELAAREAEAAAAAAERKGQAKVKRSLKTRGVAPEGHGGGGAPADDGDIQPRRDARTDVERWAAAALVQLAATDTDYAYMENAVGFSKADVHIGHYLANRVPGGLTDDEWRLAPAVCGRYWRQVGPRPGMRGAR